MLGAEAGHRRAMGLVHVSQARRTTQDSDTVPAVCW